MILNIAVGTKSASQVNNKLFVSPADSVSTPGPTDAVSTPGMKSCLNFLICNYMYCSR